MDERKRVGGVCLLWCDSGPSSPFALQEAATFKFNSAGNYLIVSFSIHALVCWLVFSNVAAWSGAMKSMLLLSGTKRPDAFI
jgi:hypothetical protein